MSTYKAVRGKTVSLGDVEIAVDMQGKMLIRAADQRMVLDEARASAVHDLMADVLVWSSNVGTTEGKLERMGEQDDAEAAKLSDERSHNGR